MIFNEQLIEHLTDDKMYWWQNRKRAITKPVPPLPAKRRPHITSSSPKLRAKLKSKITVYIWFTQIVCYYLAAIANDKAVRNRQFRCSPRSQIVFKYYLLLVGVVVS